MTQLSINEKCCVAANDYIQLRSGDFIRLEHWTCEFDFKSSLSLPSFIDNHINQSAQAYTQMAHSANDTSTKEPPVGNNLKRISSMPPRMEEPPLKRAATPTKAIPDSSMPSKARKIPKPEVLTSIQPKHEAKQTKKQRNKSDSYQTEQTPKPNELDSFLKLTPSTEPNSPGSDEVLCSLSDSDSDVLVVLSD